MIKKLSFFNRAFFKNTFLFILSGKPFFRNGHTPPSYHKIPNHFFGLSVTIKDCEEDPVGIVETCRQHHIKDVTLIIPSNRINEFSPTLMDDLIGHDIKFNIKLILMNDEDIYLQWRELLDLTLLGYQRHIDSIEIEMTSYNNKALQYFLNIWTMTFNIARLKKIKTAGPSIQSFNPFFNETLLILLKEKYQLPDIHTINLSNETDKEPESIYQNFIIPKLGKIFKYNLLKKLSLMEKITESFNIKSLYGFIKPTYEKITSYTLRSIWLSIASGSLTKLYLPYQNVPSTLFLVDQIQTMVYQTSLFHENLFEMHHFKNDKDQMHILWARDQHKLDPHAFYHIEDLYSAKIYDSNGHILDPDNFEISDTPIYFIWKSIDPIILINVPKVLDERVSNIMALS